MAERRVVVTGLGAVTPVGCGKDEVWDNLCSGVSGIDDISEFYASNYPTFKGGQIKDFKPPESVRKKYGRASQFAIQVSKEALEDAGLLDMEKEHLKRMGVIFGTTNGESQSLEAINRIWVKKGEEEIWADNILKYPVISIAENVARYFKLSSPVQMITTACAAGNYSIGLSYDLIRSGKADAMLTGGADPLTRYAFAGFGRLFALAPEKVQPFDKDRKGMMVGEGAACLILEDMESAEKRGAKIYAEVIGYGLSCDAHHMTAPRVEGIAKVMQKALKNSGIKKEDVDYICAHGTGTPANDRSECSAVCEVFGDHSKNIGINSIKSMLGHTMGAASAIEAMSCVLTVMNDIIPPTINIDNIDPELGDIDFIVNSSKKRRVNIALNNSLAFGGNNACVVFKKH